MTIRNSIISFALMFSLLLSAGTALAQAKASPAVKASDKTEVEVEVTPPLWTNGSLMFDDKTHEWIMEAIKSHEQQIPLEILLPSLFPSSNQPALEKLDKPKIEVFHEKTPDGPVEAPTYYLKSILYFGSDNWSLWLNDKKMSDKNYDEEDNIKAMNVTRRQVIFLWENSQIDRIYPNWKELFQSIDDTKYVSPEKDIVIDTLNGNISFILKPNQSFISKTLKIVEGAESSGSVAPQETAPGTTTTNLASPEDVKSAKKNSLDPMEAVRNMQMLKSILEQNVERLR